LAAALAAALAALVVAARAGAAGAGARVTVHKTALGSVLATAQGRTLYMFAVDKHGKSACYGACAKFWPPLLTSARPVAGAGVKSALLGTTVRKDGTRQVTYAGRPLYRFAEDMRSGQAKGEGVNAAGGLWWAVSPTGALVKKAQAAAPAQTTTTGTTTSGGYGSGYGRGY
jgi:predicted lipoprotein with Yx(FWY)xxD motif